MRTRIFVCLLFLFIWACSAPPESDRRNKKPDTSLHEDEPETPYDPAHNLADYWSEINKYILKKGYANYYVPKQMGIDSIYNIKFFLKRGDDFNKDEVQMYIDKIYKGDIDPVKTNIEKWAQVRKKMKVNNISQLVKVQLVPIDKDYFVINELTESQKDVKDNKTRMWEWNVKALKPGKTKLRFTVLTLLRGEEYFQEVLVIDNNINISIGFFKEVELFFSNRLDIIIATFLIPLFVYIDQKNIVKKYIKVYKFSFLLFEIGHTLLALIILLVSLLIKEGFSFAIGLSYSIICIGLWARYLWTLYLIIFFNIVAAICLLAYIIENNSSMGFLLLIIWLGITHFSYHFKVFFHQD